jgi:hypothetical protein
MTPMPWFRLYQEARTDKKLELLTDAQHRVWFNLLCYAAEQEERGIIPQNDAFLLALECAGGDQLLLAETLAQLERLRIIWIEDRYDEGDGDGPIHFTNWEKRQYDKPSDYPEATRERQRRSRVMRAESRDVTPVSRDVTPVSRDVTGVTPRVDKSRVDTEQTREEHTPPTPLGADAPQRASYSSLFEQFWRAWSTEPSKGHGSKKASFAAWQRLGLDRASADTERAAVYAGLASWQGSDQWQRGFVKDCERWLRDRRWEDDIPAAAARASPNGRVDYEAAATRLRDREGQRESRTNGARPEHPSGPLRPEAGPHADAGRTAARDVEFRVRGHSP